MLCVGVVGHVESFAKAAFDSKTMHTFSRISLLWQVAYFFILQTLTPYGTTGIFCAYVVFLTVRTAISAYLASRMELGIKLIHFLKPFLPTAKEGISFFIVFIAVSWIMQLMTKNDMQGRGFLFAIVIGVSHFGGFVYYRRDYFKQLMNVVLKSNKLD